VSSDLYTAWPRNDWDFDLVHDLPSQSPQADLSIDDPVNDTGLGPRRGDLQVPVEFASERRLPPPSRKFTESSSPLSSPPALDR
jgi:hypothetical protein